MCLKKDEDDHGPLGTPENIEAVRRSVLQSPRRSARKHHANNGHHLHDILFKTNGFKTSHAVVSESKNKIFVSRIGFSLFTLQFMEVILPHPVEETKTHILCSKKIFPSENRAFYKIMLINIVRPDGPQMAIWQALSYMLDT